MSGVLAAVSAVFVAVSCMMRQPSLLEALPLAYLCVWAGIRLPFHRLGQRVDLSYGIYIYAFPVQQLLALRGWPSHGFAVYLIATIALTLPLALASWFVVERPALRRKSSPPRWLVPQPALASAAIRPDS
jgi:peptidoglycan/LPS O-acetylase OafA/YrhL